MFGFGSKKKKHLDRWDLDTPIMTWGEGAVWDLRAAYAGLICMGGIGAGKSSSTMRVVSDALLRIGAGGIFFTVKPEDTDDYIRYVKDAGRERDLRVISLEDRKLTCNFIAQERDALGKNGDPVLLAENLSAMITVLSELAGGQDSGGGGENEQFFQLEASRLSRNCLLVLILAGKLSMPNLHKLIVSAPQTPAQAASEDFQRESFLFQCLKVGDERPKNHSLAADYDMVATYFLHEWPTLSPRTRSVVQTVLTSTTDAMSRGAARDILSSPHPNFSPADCYDGKIFVVDAPILKYREVGRIIQVALKYCWQRSAARRDVSKNNRPTFMICDEAQQLLVDSDNEFQAISRSTRTAVCYATQSFSGLLEALGGTSAEPRVNSLLSNLQTKAIHQSTDSKTVEWFQALVGRSMRLSMTGNQSHGGDWLAPLFGGDEGASTGFSQQLMHEVEAADFNTLANGGPQNNWHCEALVYQGGRQFPNGRTWLRTAIPQRG